MASFLNAFKGATNESYELGRMLWAAGALSIIGFTGYNMYLGHPFDPLQFGTGYAALMVAAGFGISKKDQTVHDVSSPPAPPPQTIVAGDLKTPNIENVTVTGAGAAA